MANVPNAFDLDSFMGNFKGGQRAYLFYFVPSWPSDLNEDLTPSDAVYLVRSTSTPEATTEEIIVPWQGYDFKFGGKKTYNAFTVTFNVDRESNILRTFLAWDDYIHEVMTNLHSIPSDGDGYFATQNLYLLDSETGDSTMQYQLVGAWPQSIAGAALGYDSNDVLQFDVTFTYQYHKIEGIHSV